MRRRPFNACELRRFEWPSFKTSHAFKLHAKLKERVRVLMRTCVEGHSKHSTHSNCMQSSKSRRRRRVNLSARLQPLTADFWNALLSMRNVTTLRCQRWPKSHTASTTTSPSRKSIMLR
eukprot:scaffold18250_cov76-Phaeocystis_antarctica.AAC.1